MEGSRVSYASSSIRRAAIALALASAVLVQPTMALAVEQPADASSSMPMSAPVTGDALANDGITGASVADVPLSDETPSGPDAGSGAPAQPAAGWVERDGARYYLDEDGAARTGWLLDGGSWYWLDPQTGAMATGWVAAGGAWYWLDPATGAMATGRAECGGAWSDFSGSGAWLGYSSGWDLRDGSWHWLEGGRRATGWRLIGGFWYWMDPDGDMATGWASVGGYRFHFAGFGGMDTGWLLDGGSWYWLDPSRGDLRTGWISNGGRWYWADPATGACARDGVVEVGSASYAFDSSCAMGEGGWCLAGGRWYWAGEGGALITGWRSVGGSWYWMDPSTGAMATGLAEIGSYRYYLAPSGAMATGWARDASEGCWYYASPDGNLLTGWQLVGGRWYWMDGATARMQTGWQRIDDSLYYLTDSGAMATNCWVEYQEGSELLLGPSGDAQLERRDGIVYKGLGSSETISGWYLSGDTWYYADEEGVLKTGWLNLDGTWYYLDPSTGAMRTGWVYVDGRWYWLASSGAMATGWVTVGGTKWQLDASGALIEAEQTPQSDLQHRIVDAAYRTPSPGGGLCAMWVSQVFNRAGLGYPEGNACDMFWWWCNKGDLRDLKVGMIIAVPSHTHTYAGGIYGHVCIYIGGNTIMDNVGYIRTMSLNEWLAYYTTTYTPMWGWCNSMPLE